MDLRHTLRSLRSMPHIVLGGVPAERAGDERLLFRRLGVHPDPTFHVASDVFGSGGAIPRIYTVDGDGLPPPIRWQGTPSGAKELALIVEDPDAPTPHPFVHWIVTGLDAETTNLAQALGEGGHVGRNSMLRNIWAGCAPPRGDNSHRYVFQLFALDRRLPSRDGIGRTTFFELLRGRVLAMGMLIGTYRRS